MNFNEQKFIKNPNYLFDIIDNINDNNVNDIFERIYKEATLLDKIDEIIILFLQKLLQKKIFKNYDFFYYTDVFFYFRIEYHDIKKIDVNLYSIDHYVELIKNFTYTNYLFDFTKYQKYDIKIYYALSKALKTSSNYDKYRLKEKGFIKLIQLTDFYIKKIKESDKKEIFPLLGLFLIKYNYKPTLDEVHKYIGTGYIYTYRYDDYIINYLKTKINNKWNIFNQLDYVLDNCDCSLTKETLKVLCNDLANSKYIEILKNKFGIIQEYVDYVLNHDYQKLEECILSKKIPSNDAIKEHYIKIITSKLDYHKNKNDILDIYNLKPKLFKDIDKTICDNKTTINSDLIEISRPLKFCRKYKEGELNPTIYDLFESYTYVVKKICILHLQQKYENKDTTKEIASIIKRVENGEKFTNELKYYIKPPKNSLIPENFLKKKKLKEKDFLRTLKHDDFYLFLVAINKVDYSIDLDILLYYIRNNKIKYYLKLILLQKYENIKTDHIIDFIHQEFLHNKN
ncbi:MAG: hypothetical protein CMF62_04070 [Magnetococcales bacterium]|nr:hypothetical protein [Magnetococcales bacterium]|tara:strand:- start:8759 stop:10294 length:1536 start_codon:yes stop_codon:yes gene_type:complete